MSDLRSNQPQKAASPLLWWQKLFGHRVWKATVLHTLELVALIMALFLVICGGIAWRLAQGPISLNFLRPDATAALARTFDGARARIDQIGGAWSSSEHAFVITADTVRVFSDSGAVLLNAPKLEVGLSGLDLLRGHLVPKKIIAVGGEFSVVRRADGASAAGIGRVNAIMRTAQLPGKENPRAPASLPALLSRLDVLALQGVTLNFVDEISNVRWVAPDTRIRFFRKNNRIQGDATGTIKSDGEVTRLHVSGSARADFSAVTLSLSIKNASPARLLPADGKLAAIAGLAAPLDAELTLVTGEDGLLRSADGMISVTAGRYHFKAIDTPVQSIKLVMAFDPVDAVLNINSLTVQTDYLSGTLGGSISGFDPARLQARKILPFDIEAHNIKFDPGPAFSTPPRIKALAMTGHYEPGAQRLSFSDMAISLHDLTITGHGQVDFPTSMRAPTDNLIRFDGRSSGEMSPATLLGYWPVQLAKGGRDWINNNVIDGRLFDLVLHADIPQSVRQAGRLENDMLALSFAFDHAQSHFVHTMTPLHDGAGTGLLQGNRFDLVMREARIFDTRLSKGFVNIPRLSPKGVTGHFGAEAQGALADVLSLLDEEPLFYARRYDIAPKNVTGMGAITFSIARPMRVSVPAKKIKFTANGHYNGVAVADMVAGRAISDAAVDFTANATGLNVSGHGKVDVIDTDFTWKETFFPIDEPRTVITAKAVTDASVFDGFGLPSRLFLDGPLTIQLKTEGEGKVVNKAWLDMDMTKAALMAPGEVWQKPAGAAGHAHMTISHEDGGVYNLSEIQADANGFSFKGQAVLGPQGILRSAVIDQARMDGVFDLDARLTRVKDGPFVVKAQARNMDARGFVRGLASGAGQGLDIDIDMDMTFDRALVADDLTLKNGTLQLSRTAEHFNTLDFKAETPNGVSRFSITRNEDQCSLVKGRSDDAGLILEALFGASSVEGGVLKMDGMLGTDEGAPTKIDLAIKDFRLRNLPVLARILALGSFGSIADSLSGEGLAFKSLKAPLVFKDGIMTIDNARATGSALGITAAGTVDLGAKTMDIKGALSPAYFLNSALGSIPLVGKALTSRKGEGVFGLSYSVKGPYDALQVFVNPLSAMTPGFLRRIFEGGSEKKIAPSPKEDKIKPETEGAGDTPDKP